MKNVARLGWLARSAPALVIAAAGLSFAGFARAGTVPFQFRVNAANPTLGVFLQPPTIGLVYGGSGVGGNVTDAMAFSWPDVTIAAVAIPICDRTCGGFIINESFGGGGQSFPEHLFLRRFNNAGVPVDAGDITWAATTTMDNHGAFQTPSIGCCPVNGGVNRFNPFRLAWWDMWTWDDRVHPCANTDCNHQPVGWWHVHFPNFTSPAPTSGSAAFIAPAFCQGHRASVAYAGLHDLVAWRDVLDPCRQILGGFDGVYVRPPLAGSLVIRAGQAGFDVDRPCAAWRGAGDFVVSWREDDLSTFNSGISVRRVAHPGVLGLITEVTFSGGASPNSASAVSMFDDGSFVVQFAGFQNGDPPVTPLLAQRFDNQEPPNPFGPAVEVLPNWDGNLNHTITARGPDLLSGKLSSIFELPNGNGGISDIYGRAIDPATGAIGPITLIPLNDPQSFSNRIGEAHQHTALLRSDGATAVAWHRAADGHDYCTVRTLPLPLTGVCCRGAICELLEQVACTPPAGFLAGATFVPDAPACNDVGNFVSPCCNADYNQSGAVSVQDIFDFLADYFAGSPYCDINQSGAVSVQDIFDFLAAYFAGC